MARDHYEAWVLAMALLASLQPPHAQAQAAADALPSPPADTQAAGDVPRPSSARGQVYFDSRKNEVRLPLGPLSFADEIVSFTSGNPPVSDSRWSDPQRVLGPPNYGSGAAERRKQESLTLGCAGELVVRFTDNALVDVDGPDLYVFEVGPAIEAMAVAISSDGAQWIDVGRIAGGVAAADIANVAQPGTTYHFVRLTDLRAACGGAFPGADLDAIGAIGSALHLSLSGAVLFDTGQSTLKPEAQRALDEVVVRIGEVGDATVAIEGHTDSVGSNADNQALSDARARAVREHLSSIASLSSMTLTSRGYGEERPIASNDTDEGRGRNRRVEIVVTPGR